MNGRIKITVLILGMATTFSLNIQAQQVTYSHDASKMNQITVMKSVQVRLLRNTITGYYTTAIVRQPLRKINGLSNCRRTCFLQAGGYVEANGLSYGKTWRDRAFEYG